MGQTRPSIISLKTLREVKCLQVLLSAGKRQRRHVLHTAVCVGKLDL